MPKLKNLSGKDVISILMIFGFSVDSQKGSHVKLVRYTNEEKQSLTIPQHKEIDKGTLKAIIRQASRYISLEDLKNYFYTD
jgi:predicted RNA binding protein YcfA (HicA-like mRNA interferase family)